ncbi:hypothetical protein LTR36_002422 [Oleoguttula mirabilis]|uniref:PHD-type domain-containing protein n=1 Tax=Oleoguttula mirabilis TaxID=1507867 RepID=A0AAV9JLS0_9PEZI|nr:hypothetical protein LTR36_002422 [Oleoguttula mirabilis]
MPPTSDVRKTSVANSNAAGESSFNAKRTASGRAIRSNTTRPANYYARPFGSLSAAPAANAIDNEAPDAVQPGFFPALQYFSDAIMALPKEVMRQFTLMKEVEAKIHGPNEQLGEMIDALMEQPVPPRKSAAQSMSAAQQQGLMSLTRNNSAMGSASASLVNGFPGGRQHSGEHSVPGSVVSEEVSQPVADEELARRKQYLELRVLTHSLTHNLDEKNVVLAEANRVLALQLLRVDSVMPHVENEISEEARLGSMTHWAYSDNRQKKAVAAAPNRRDVAATNNLAAAANAVHETEIAQARREAGREAVKEKHAGKGKRQQEQMDSDFDDKPKKVNAKIAGKGKAAAGQAAVNGLGISTNGDLVKRRKVDKGLTAPGMERSMSGISKAAKIARETPRSTPAAEPSKKTTKAKPAPPLPKKRIPNSAQNSPAMASSPLHSSFIVANMEPPPSARPQSARLRQNSSATNLRHERVMDTDGRPPSAAGKVNGTEKPNGKRKAPHDEAEEHADTAEERQATRTTERGDPMKREADTDLPNQIDLPPASSRSASNSGKAGGASKTATPRNENFPSDIPALSRARSTRSLHNNARDSSSSEPQQQGVKQKQSGHKRNFSNRHLVKQLAPFNRSPDLDRHRDNDDEDVESLDGQERPEQRTDEGQEEPAEERRGRRSRPISRRNTLQNHVAAAAPAPSPPASAHEEEEEQAVDVVEDMALPDVPEPAAFEPVQPADEDQPHSSDIEEAPPELVPDNADLPQHAVDEDVDEESEHDPDDPNEPKYCYCNRGSYGEMVACDNDACPREWFHLGCTELREAPGEDEMWYCKECRPQFSKKRSGGKGRPGSSRQ